MATVTHIILWIVAGTCGLVWLLIAAGNAAIAASWFTRGNRAALVPIVGGLFGVFAVWLLPLELGDQRLLWALLPATLDIGFVPLFLIAAIALLRRAPLETDHRPPTSQTY